MPAPEGYTALGFVGFTDKGGYDETDTYTENDIVHYANIAWRCLADDTTGVTPEEGLYWEIFIEGDRYYKGTYATFPRPPLPEDLDKFFVDIETDPRLMYTWDEESEDYILTGGAGGADGSSMDITITLLASGWTGDTAPYSQTVTVPQMRDGMTPYFFLTSGGDDERYAFSLLTGYTTGYAQITFQAADLPDVDIPITLKGIPAQEMEYVDNTVVLIVDPSGFELSTDPDYDGRYVSTIAVEGMSAGAEGGSWDIVRSGAVLSLEESEIAAHITDVKPMDGAVQIVCTEIPAATYLLKLTGTFAEATPGDVILPNLLQELKKEIYPVGSVYMSFSDIDPGTLFGGVWEAIEGRFLLAAGENYVAGVTGGEATHTLTVQEMPSHNHNFIYTTPSGFGYDHIACGNQASTYTGTSDIQNTGGGQPHNNMPPYVTVYMWKRIE